MTTLEAGAVLGHYRILGLLGRGGMADVYRAKDDRLGREVALKVLPAEFARDGERVARFESEVRSAAGLSHPNIVPVFEYGEGEGLYFYAMALAPGGDLKERIQATPGGMRPGQALALAAALAGALDHAHEGGLVHRDVKPENVLFTADGTPQLTDFGIVRAAGGAGGMTAAGMSVGSSHYMSPEQARGQDVDGRSDLYSLGAVLFEMLTGETPFDGADTMAIAYAQVFDPAPPLPAALAGHQPLLDRLLAKAPEDRYDAASEVAAACARAAEEETGSFTGLIARPGSAGLAPRGVAAPSGTRLMDAVKGAGADGGDGSGSARASRAAGRRRRRLALAGLGAAAALAVAAGVVAMRDSADRPAGGGGGGSAARTANRNLPRPEEARSPQVRPPVPLPPPDPPAEAEEPEPAELEPPEPESPELEQPEPEPPPERSRREEPERIPDQTLAEDVALRVERALSRGVGQITVRTTPSDAWVEVNGERVARTTPVTLDDVPAGPVMVKLGAEEHREVEVREEVPLDGHLWIERTLARLPDGPLTLDLTPPRAVVRSTELPADWRSGMPLSPGAYRIEVNAPGFKSQRLTVAHGRSATTRAVVLDPVALASFGRFHVVEHELSESENHDAVCKEGLGDAARLADWDDIVGYYSGGGSHRDFVAGLRLAVEGRELGPGELTNGLRVSSGGRFLWGAGRHFFVARHDGGKPSHFIAHREVGGHLLSLGSWSGTGGHVLCYGVHP